MRGRAATVRGRRTIRRDFGREASGVQDFGREASGERREVSGREADEQRLAAGDGREALAVRVTHYIYEFVGLGLKILLLGFFWPALSVQNGTFSSIKSTYLLFPFLF